LKHSNQHYHKSSPKKSSPQGSQGSPLRQRMHEDMLLSNLSQKTQDSYINGALKLARYYRRSPSDLSEEEVRNFILFSKDESGLSVETVRVSFYGIKFLYQKSLGRKLHKRQLTMPLKTLVRKPGLLKKSPFIRFVTLTPLIYWKMVWIFALFKVSLVTNLIKARLDIPI